MGKSFRFECIFSLIIIISSASCLFGQKSSPLPGSRYFSDAEIRLDKSGRSPAAIRFEEGNRPIISSFFEEFRKAFPFSENNEMRLWQTLPDKLGQIHYRFNQYYKGIEVLGAQYILHEENGYVRYANGELVPGLNLNVAPVLSEPQALDAALKNIDAESYMWQNDANEAFLKREQNDPDATFYPSGELKITSGWEELLSENCKLVYRFDIYAEKPLGRYYVDVDARNGEIVGKYSRIHDADYNGSGISLYNGTVNIVVDSYSGGYRLREAGRSGVQTYDMHNTTNYNTAVDFVDSDGNFTASNAHAGVSAHWGAEATYDYYFNVHSRNSYNNTGGILLSYVHRGVNYNNAYWDGTRMTYGDGDGTTFSPLVSIDVTGHEISHGVTEYSANLIYENEPGALNESFSDIFGTAIEFYVEGSSGDWLIGEDIYLQGIALRSMEDPNSVGDPDTYFGNNWAPLSSNPNQLNDYGGVHTNSSVQNYWFYLLSEGGSGVNDNGDSYNVSGIGIDDAALIAYRSLTGYLTGTSEFMDARNGSIDAATDLFGDPSQQLQSVKDAWDAVGVYAPVVPSGILVWEGQLGGQDYSGAYVNNCLTNAGFEVRYTSVFPATLIGFDGVFLSFGNYGSGGSNTVFNSGMASAVQAYLQAGGKVYLEGGDALGYDQRLNSTLLGLFGLSSTIDGGTNTINSLQGQSGALTNGMLFTASTQVNNTWIDRYTPGSGTLSFVESPYGNVAVQNSGSTYGQKTFCFSYALAELTDAAAPSTRDDLLAGILDFFQLTPPRVTVNAKIFLEGPYNAGSMNTYLRDNTLLPTSQPFSGPPWNYSGTESVASVPAGVVDWMLVELRSGTLASSEVSSRAVFVKSDGSVVDLDGTSPVSFNGIVDGNYHVVMYHRNHLSVMSNATLALSDASALYNFTTAQSQAYGTSPMKDLGSGVFGMCAGNGNADGSITTADREDIWRPQNGAEWDYSKLGDFNLDGGIDAADLNDYWRPNQGRTTQVP